MTMRQKDFEKRKVLARLNRAQRRFCLMIAGEAEENVPRHRYMRVRGTRFKVRRQAVRTLQI